MGDIEVSVNQVALVQDPVALGFYDGFQGLEVGGFEHIGQPARRGLGQVGHHEVGVAAQLGGERPAETGPAQPAETIYPEGVDDRRVPTRGAHRTPGLLIRTCPSEAVSGDLCDDHHRSVKLGRVGLHVKDRRDRDAQLAQPVEYLGVGAQVLAGRFCYSDEEGTVVHAYPVDDYDPAVRGRLDKDMPGCFENAANQAAEVGDLNRELL